MNTGTKTWPSQNLHADGGRQTNKRTQKHNMSAGNKGNLEKEENELRNAGLRRKSCSFIKSGHEWLCCKGDIEIGLK